MRYVLIIFGSTSLLLGIVGIFLPLLPTTPFLLLSAFLFAKSSDKLYNWLLEHKHFGSYIQDFRIHKCISLKAKIISLTMLWGTMTYTIIFVVPILAVKIGLALVAISVSIYILSFKTKNN